MRCLHVVLKKGWETKEVEILINFYVRPEKQSFDYVPWEGSEDTAM